MSDPVILAILRVAGAGLLLLAALHIPIGRCLDWKNESTRLSPANAAVFHVHTLFICAVISGMGLVCLVEPSALLLPSRAGLWMSGFFTAFWGLRCFAQYFLFPSSLHLGKPRETLVHRVFQILWPALTLSFGYCFLRQLSMAL